MTKLKPHDLRRAADLAVEIARLEKLRDMATDTAVAVRIGAPQGPGAGQLSPATLAMQLGIQPTPHELAGEVTVTIAAATIRAQLVDRLAPLYDQLRRLGIELDLS